MMGDRNNDENSDELKVRCRKKGRGGVQSVEGKNREGCDDHIYKQKEFS